MILKEDEREILETAIREAHKAGGYSDKAVHARLKKSVRGMESLALLDVTVQRKAMGIKLPRGRSKQLAELALKKRGPKPGAVLAKRRKSDDPTPGDNYPVVTLKHLTEAIAEASVKVTEAGAMLEQFKEQEKARIGV